MSSNVVMSPSMGIERFNELYGIEYVALFEEAIVFGVTDGGKATIRLNGGQKRRNIGNCTEYIFDTLGLNSKGGDETLAF